MRRSMSISTHIHDYCANAFWYLSVVGREKKLQVQNKKEKRFLRLDVNKNIAYKIHHTGRLRPPPPRVPWMIFQTPWSSRTAAAVVVAVAGSYDSMSSSSRRRKLEKASYTSSLDR
jgi:hypothetical protein